MDREFVDEYINVFPEQTLAQIILLEMFCRIMLKYKLFRPGSLDWYPKALQ